MRDAFFDSLFEIARKDKDVILITADTGAICHDKFKKVLPDQYINIGIAEQNMVGVAAGLALAGKTVYIYAIIPFVTMRCYEQIRINLCCMNLPVKVVGIGAGFDYSTLGPTHHGTEDISLIRSLPDIDIYSPSDSLSAALLAKVSYRIPGPVYIRLDRTGYPAVYKKAADIGIRKGFSVLKKGRDLCIIATGRMVCTAIEAAKRLADHSVDAGVIDLFRIKPIEIKTLLAAVGKGRRIVTLEEHFISGGMGESIAAELASLKSAPKAKIIGINNNFCRKYGTREYLLRLNGLDANSVTEDILEWSGR
jgi:transketolase